VNEIRKKGNGKRYDCIIGVSGGVDSTMVAYHIKRLGLRPLAIHFDNGWNDELAVQNIEKCLKTLEIDLITEVVEWGEFRDIQMSLFKASVPNVEAATDHAIMALLYKKAAEHGIKYIISGGNIATEGIMPKSWMYDNRDLKHIKAIHRKFGTHPMRTYPCASLLTYAWHVFVRRIRYVPILNYTSYNKIEAKTLITNELGWRDYGGKHYESFFTKFFQSYYLPVKFGMDKRRPHLSTLINSGQITRESAIIELEKLPYEEGKIQIWTEYFLKKMKINSDEWKILMETKPMRSSNYPSNAWLLKNTRLISFIKGVTRPKSLR
jgi:N-acetyl sugar amidotransferase